MALAIFPAPTTRGPKGRRSYSIPQGAASLETASDERAARSLSNTSVSGFIFQGSGLARLPEMTLQVHAKFNDGDALAFEKLSLEQSVGPTNEDVPAVANHAVPRNAFSGGSGRHSTSTAAHAAGQA